MGGLFWLGYDVYVDIVDLYVESWFVGFVVDILDVNGVIRWSRSENGGFWGWLLEFFYWGGVVGEGVVVGYKVVVVGVGGDIDEIVVVIS